MKTDRIAEVGIENLTPDEVRLVRLFRLMNAGEKNGILIDAAKTPMMRHSVDPFIGKFVDAETAQRELSDELTEDFDSRLFRAWPGSWPGQSLVDLDNLGDPGAVLESWLADLLELLFGISSGDETVAKQLAIEYLSFLEGRTDLSPVDHDFTYEEALEECEKEFLGFIREWRERAIQTMERQALVSASSKSTANTHGKNI